MVKNKKRLKKLAIIENHELVIANKRVKSLEQKISFRDKGKSGNYTAELIKAKAERDLILSDINRKSGVLETDNLMTYALEVKEKGKALKKDMEELKERIHAINVFMDLYNSKTENLPKAENLIIKEKPSLVFIGTKIRKANREALKIAEHALNRVKTKAEAKRGTAYSGKFAGELQRARDNRDLILKDIQHETILIEYKELRAEIEYLKTIVVELEAKNVERQAEKNKREKENALLKKYGFIKGD